MSYQRGGYRRRYRDDIEERRPVVETWEDKIRTAIIKLGEVDVVEELPRIQKDIRDQLPLNLSALSEAFRVAVTEQPYKIPFYAELLRLLYDVVDFSGMGPPIGRQILEDFWKGFQAYLDKQAWRETRLCIHFFAHLTVANLISPESLFALLQAFTAVFDEFGVSYGRAKRAALCAAEGLMIGGPILKQTSGTNVSEIIDAIQAFNETTASTKWLVQPSAKFYEEPVPVENADELLDTLLTTLRALDEADFAPPIDGFPRPYIDYPPLDPSRFEPFNLPQVLVPPEVIELDGLSTDSGEDAQVKKEEWPEYQLRLFDNEISPSPTLPAGYAVRTALLDIIDIFEVNRKECSRLLLEYPKWTLPGTFKPKSTLMGEFDPVPGKDWQLESTIIETVLGAYLFLPEANHKSIYYIGLITELCKLSPSTVGPAVGKSIRKLYNSLSDGLDVEGARRFAEWFAVHMSNFGFQWVWREWVPDLALTTQHPRRCFMRRAVEFEIRLAYHERILKTLPEALQSPDAQTIPEQAPGPDFEYDDPNRLHYEAAQEVLNRFRGRAKAEDVISYLDTLRSSLEASEDSGHVNVDSIVRSIVVQSLLHIGSRSFSHLLNAIERYLPLLRHISMGSGGSTTATNGAGGGGRGTTASGIGTGSTEAKVDILTAAASFWKYNRQMVGIVFDKLMQYQIVDPTDVVAWTFANGTRLGELANSKSLSAFEWDLLKGALDKANGRVVVASRKVKVLRKEDDDTRARVMASAEVNSMEVDADARRQEETPENPALASALKGFTILTREQKMALSSTLEGFITCLAPSASNLSANGFTRAVITEDAWHNRANWNDDEWNAWETWGWFRQFCRAVVWNLGPVSTSMITDRHFALITRKISWP
ncbi:hypothetical protein AX16_000920 [Volvariella volvacea WC 439]|nr:hypothetical protein AX16_000920 [Volvariella volvacea WC 439]